ncbi:hypothetical protein ACRALDRAFT_1070847 [Sodiomyces alcalophilus JCM 7366]|uniref:uncharacterized protein n=1 Tax=Sodiomyces alcalophilus JCM 7366 TaxID=591952 RepID=UPI0039B5EBC7
MSPKIILFTGPPDPSSIDWTASDLLTDFTPPISTFLGIPSLAHDHGLPKSTNIGSSRNAAWRSLPLKRPQLETGHSHLHAHPNLFVSPDVNFCSTASLSFSLDSPGDEPETQDGGAPSQKEQRQDLLSQFYDHSLARHQDIPSSQLPPASHPSLDDTTKTTTSFFGNSGSFSSSNGDPSSPSSARPPLGNTAASTHLSDLEDIPSAPHLLALVPQTVTVNLIAGVISIAAPRTVVTRHGTRMSLVEVLLGDETRAGFAVTFWLPAASAAAAADRESELLADALARLRTQDVVLLQNVALNVFMGRVYGQSLRKGWTKLHLLHRRRLDPGDEEGYYRARDFARAAPNGRASHPQFEKTRRVRDWVLRFVRAAHPAVSDETGSKPAAGKRRKGWGELPPDDTQ